MDVGDCLEGIVSVADGANGCQTMMQAGVRLGAFWSCFPDLSQFQLGEPGSPDCFGIG